VEIAASIAHKRCSVHLISVVFFTWCAVRAIVVNSATFCNHVLTDLT
jgi:hypothetical protein